MTLVIAIDGPAAAGKGTLARRLAAALDFAFLDTGLIYRAVAAKVLAAGGDPADQAAALAAAQGLVMADLARPDLRDEAVGQGASLVATVSAVRAALLQFQRDFAAKPPEGQAGAVLDGRDIGTVVCPEADLKIYVTASPEVRAARILQGLQGLGSVDDELPTDEPDGSVAARLASLKDLRDPGEGDVERRSREIAARLSGLAQVAVEPVETPVSRAEALQARLAALPKEGGAFVDPAALEEARLLNALSALGG